MLVTDLSQLDVKEKDWKKALTTVDVDGDGVISADEFQSATELLQKEMDRLIKAADETERFQKETTDGVVTFVTVAININNAYLLSNACYYTLVEIPYGPGDASNLQHQLYARIMYFAGCCALFGPPLLYFLLTVEKKITHNMCCGDFLHHNVQLWIKTLPVLIAWGGRDVIKGAVNAIGTSYDPNGSSWNVYSQRFVLALSCTFAVALFQLLPCYKRAVTQDKVAAANKKHPDLGTHYWVYIFGKLGLALGYSWNKFFKAFVDVNEHNWITTTELIVLCVIFLIEAYFITFATFQFEVRKYLQDRWVEKNDGTRCGSSVLRYIAIFGVDYFWQVSSVFMGAMTFVFGWGLSDVLNKLVFGAFNGCNSAGSCAWQVNLIYSVGVSIIFSILSPIISKSTSSDAVRQYKKMGWNDEYAHKAAQIRKNLLLNSFGLIVGWAWSDFADSIVTSILHPDGRKGPTGWDGVKAYWGVTIVVFLVCGFIYHKLMEYQEEEDSEVLSRGYLADVCCVPKECRREEVMEDDEQDADTRDSLEIRNGKLQDNHAVSRDKPKGGSIELQSKGGKVEVLSV